jgi:hypothetical protein
MAKKSKRPTLGDPIKDAKITVADMKAALDAVDSLPEEDRKDFTGRTIAVMRAFGLLTGRGSGQGLTDRDREQITKVTAVQIRIEAIAKLAKHPKFKAWSRESGTDGMLLIREDVLKAAAEVPLYDHQGKGSYFDPDEFFTHVLAVAEEDGRA